MADRISLAIAREAVIVGSRCRGHAAPVDMAKELLTLRGQPTIALWPASLVIHALHTTSDLPIILVAPLGLVLRDAHWAEPSDKRKTE